MQLVEELFAQGNSNILGTHATTFEITKDHELTKRGDCVIAVKATKAPIDLSPEFKRACRQQGARITIRLEAVGLIDVVQGSGSPNLSFTHPNEMVGRKSSYVSDRTLMIKADKAACDLDRRLVKALTSPKTVLTAYLTVKF
jgi:hypothetical protein